MYLVLTVPFFSGVENLKPVVSEDDYHRLMGFPYLASETAIKEFGEWVASLKKKQVQGN
jgi:hypothetical protein